MANKLSDFGGTNWSDGDILYSADQIDSIVRMAREPWYKYLKFSGAVTTGLIKYTTDVWQTATGRTTTSGAAWVAGGYNATSAEDIAFSFSGAAIAGDYSDGSMAYTSDSGATWQAATTGLSGANTVICMSLASETVGVAGGTTAATRTCWYTTNGGDDWSVCATGFTTNVTGITMASTTVGYAFTTNEILKTTDGGVNWTDTTDDTAYAVNNALATDADTVYAIGDAIKIMKYVNSTNTITELARYALGSASFTNLVKATNGNVYSAVWVQNGTNGTIYLVKIDTSNDNVYIKPVTIPYQDDPTAYYQAGGANGILHNLIEINDTLYLNIGENILEISVKDE